MNWERSRTSAAEQRTFARLDDKPIVAFGVVRAKGASDVTVDALVAERLAKIQAEHPEVVFSKVDTQVDNVVGNYKSTMETLIEGALLAVVVVLLFLRDWRARWFLRWRCRSRSSRHFL